MEGIYKAMIEMEIPVKVTKPARMTLTNADNKILVNGLKSNSFSTGEGVRQPCSILSLRKNF